jgi:hypothetical protein
MKDKLRRYGPLVGVALLAGVVILRALGLEEWASAISVLGVVTGLSEQSPVGMGELAAAIGAAVGVGLKLRSQWRKTHSTEEFVTPPTAKG